MVLFLCAFPSVSSFDKDSCCLRATSGSSPSFVFFVCIQLQPCDWAWRSICFHYLAGVPDQLATACILIILLHETFVDWCNWVVRQLPLPKGVASFKAVPFLYTVYKIDLLSQGVTTTSQQVVCCLLSWQILMLHLPHPLGWWLPLLSPCNTNPLGVESLEQNALLLGPVKTG